MTTEKTALTIGVEVGSTNGIPIYTGIEDLEVKIIDIFLERTVAYNMVICHTGIVFKQTNPPPDLDTKNAHFPSKARRALASQCGFCCRPCGPPCPFKMILCLPDSAVRTGSGHNVCHRLDAGWCGEVTCRQGIRKSYNDMVKDENAKRKEDPTKLAKGMWQPIRADRMVTSCMYQECHVYTLRPRCCGSCLMAYYCSRRCQRLHWSFHIRQCGENLLSKLEFLKSQESTKDDAQTLNNLLDNLVQNERTMATIDPPTVHVPTTLSPIVLHLNCNDDSPSPIQTKQVPKKKCKRGKRRGKHRVQKRAIHDGTDPPPPPPPPPQSMQSTQCPQSHPIFMQIPTNSTTPIQ